MKILTNNIMKRIATKYKLYRSERIIILSKHANKEASIRYLTEELDYLYSKLGLEE